MVAQDTLHQVEIAMQQRGRGFLLGLLADIEPEAIEKVHVGGDLFFRYALSGGTHNEATGCADAMSLQNPFDVLSDLRDEGDASDNESDVWSLHTQDDTMSTQPCEESNKAVDCVRCAIVDQVDPLTSEL